jgi:hypothetical protein
MIYETKIELFFLNMARKEGHQLFSFELLVGNIKKLYLPFFTLVALFIGPKCKFSFLSLASMCKLGRVGVSTGLVN